jgi:hypothetical protein
MQMRLIRHNDNVLRSNINEPREGKLGIFSFLESLKKHKRRLHWGTFFKGSLIGSKKGQTSTEQMPIQNHFNECDKDNITRQSFHI